MQNEVETGNDEESEKTVQQEQQKETEENTEEGVSGGDVNGETQCADSNNLDFIDKSEMSDEDFKSIKTIDDNLNDFEGKISTG